MILQVTRNVMTAILSLPAGDIYNLSVTACTERGSNTSTLHLVKLGKMSAWRWGAGGTRSSQLNETTEKWLTLFYKCKIVVYATKRVCSS